MGRAPIESIPLVADVRRVAGAAAPPDGPADLLLEVPHGATRAADFDVLRDALRGPFPEDLRDFFFVNTDVGAPEVATRLAERVAAADPGRAVLVVRCRIPRTFIDCNRLVDASTRPSSESVGGVTPGVAAYVRDPDDFRLLLGRHAAYRGLAERAYEEVCGAGGTALMLHSYAPKEIDVPVDERIVERLREAYAPGAYGRWALRPEADLITRDLQGRRLADEGLVEAVVAAFRAAGVDCRTDTAYALHPSTMGHHFASRYPGRTLCLEMRRDLLAREFAPFREMEIDAAKADRMAAALAAALPARAAGR